jgi:hypothetical protein
MPALIRPEFKRTNNAISAAGIFIFAETDLCFCHSLSSNMKNKITQYLNMAAVSCILLAALMVSPAGLRGQGQNALDFDGFDDHVNVTGASALITGATGLSLSLWVYPVNPNSAWPDFDGFAGLRNDINADFYLVQLNSTTVEARYRPSSGATYTISYPGLQMNTWQHYALVFTGTHLKLYYNGTAADSVPASGSISSSSVPFYIGRIVYYSNIFNFQGRIDEVALWNKALTASEVRCIFEDGVGMPDANLKLWFAMNEGTANGNNMGYTVLFDSSLNLPGTLSGFAMAGSVSNFVNGVVSFETIYDTICTGSSYVFGGQTLTAAGDYTSVFTAASGCDSTVVLHLAVASLNASITQAGDTLKCNVSGAAYRWLKCDNNYSVIPGAAGQNFVPSTGGSFGVEVTKDGCTDTSNCIQIVVTGLEETVQQPEWSIYPNPASNLLHVNPWGREAGVITLLDLTGKEVIKSGFNKGREAEIDLSGLQKGIWLIRLESAGKSDYRKLIIQ